MASTEGNRRDSRAAEVAREEGGGGSEAGSMSYEDLLNLYEESLRNLAEGEVVTGRVIDVTNNNVVVDVGYKSEGLIPLEEFVGRDGQIRVQIGDEVDVLLESTEDQEGHVLLSKTKADRMKVWEE